MKKIVTMAALAGGALALAACGAKQEEAPAEPVVEETMTTQDAEPAPAAEGEEAPADDATATEEELDPTGNPIVPG